LEEEVQRRGVHVNIPKIGSRVGVCCFGGILGGLRCFTKRIERGKLVFSNFWDFWAVGSRGVGGGGTLCALFVRLRGILFGQLVGFCGFN
jgi:hypothetical protein